MKNVYLVYFSPAFSTRKSARILGKSICEENTEHDITLGLKAPLTFTPDDLVIFAMPVYAGRIPAHAALSLKKIRGNNTPAIIICVYGNRDYDDALLELQDVVETNGFEVLGAAAFIARHSIFPDVAANRPDEDDSKHIIDFGKQCLNIFEEKTNFTAKPQIKGNRPYKTPGKIPFAPTANSKCDGCETCVKQCPAGAISAENPKKTNKDLCIVCTRCIAVCPKKARKLGGIIYKIASKKFSSAYSSRKEPEIFLRTR